MEHMSKSNNIAATQLILSTRKVASHIMSKYAVIVTAYLWTVSLSGQVACTTKVQSITSAYFLGDTAYPREQASKKNSYRVLD